MTILKIMHDMCFIKHPKCKKKVHSIETSSNYDWWTLVHFSAVLVSGWRLTLAVLTKLSLLCDLDPVCLLFSPTLTKCTARASKSWDRFYKTDHDVYIMLTPTAENETFSYRYPKILLFNFAKKKDLSKSMRCLLHTVFIRG